MPSTVTKPKTFRLKNAVVKLLAKESKERDRSEAYLVGEALESFYKEKLKVISPKEKRQ